VGGSESSVVDPRVAREVVKKIDAIAQRARREDETGRYSIDAEDWRLLQELLTSLRKPDDEREGKRVEHAFMPTGQCSGCGMTQGYFDGAMSILRGWPEDSEKEERMAELGTCRNDVKSVQGRGAGGSRRPISFNLTDAP
jgi:hypothetical protein